MAEFSPTTTQTTNANESYRSKLNAIFYNANRNIFLFVNALEELQVEVHLKMRSVGKRRRQTVEKEKFLSDNMLLENGSLDRGQNLERRNVERSIFRNFIANIKMTKDELFDSFIVEFIFFFFDKLFK